MTSQFDREGQYFAQITDDGKLKIWNTASNSLEQEYVPDLHLASPCTCLQFVECSEVSTKNGASPKNKRRRSSSSLEIILGTTSGKLLIFSVSKGEIKCTIDSNVHLPVRCLSRNCGDITYSGVDENVVAWNIRQRNIASKWKAGNECISAVLAVSSSNKLLTASKSIKLWNLEDQTLLKTFKGHSSDVNFLYSVPSHDSIESTYVISGSRNDRLLNCWNISNNVKDFHTSASLLLEDYVTNISLNCNETGTTKVSVSIANGAVHIFQVVLNGKCSKPIKPKSTIRVVADTGQKKDVIIPIYIVSSFLRNEDTILLAHGSSVVLTFEELEPNNKKLICLMRQHPHLQKQSEVQTDKVITPLVGKNATYLSPFSNVAAVTKRKLDNSREVTMEKRLENLTFSKEDGPVPKSNNMAHLLLQGLRSKDKNIIKTVMLTTNEQTVRNTIRRLPINVIYELVEQIAVFMQGNNHIQTRAAALWLKHLLETHATLFMSNPELPAIFSTIRNYSASRLATMEQKRLFGLKLNVIISEQVNVTTNNDEEDDDEALIFNDRDTSSESEAESMDTDENEELSTNDIDEDEDMEEDVDDTDENELSD